MSNTQNTQNDEAIAKALAREEHEQYAARLSSQQTSNNNSSLPSTVVVPGRPVSRNTTTTSRRQSPASAYPGQQQQQFQNYNLPIPPHMCMAPCVIGHDGVCVEMLVDTGAQTSVISLPLVQQLKLEAKIDASRQGIASGVGQARIVGRLCNVPTELGHVEFPMDFIVLDVPEKMLLLGLDLMRRYKCIVDLERDVLIFGGSGGVEVHMLPADQQHVDAVRRQLTGCPMM